MTTIKNFFALTLLLAFVAIFNTNTASAQAGVSKLDLVANANDVDSVITGLLLPAVQKIREAAARISLEKQLNLTHALAQKVIRAGSKMSDAQFSAFKREIAANDKAYATWARGRGSVQNCIQDCINDSNSSYWRRICIQDCIGSWITSQGSTGRN